MKSPQVLAVLGNRTVVFGAADDSGPIEFVPEEDSIILPRVPSSRNAPRDRIVQHLKVAGCRVIHPVGDIDSGYDLLLEGTDGSRVLVDLKYRDGAPTDRELERFAAETSANNALGVPIQVWRFSSDPLSLVISSVHHGKLQHRKLVPLNVWEATENGIFDRARVLDRVNDWERRLADFFSQISEWIGERPPLRAEQSRSVTMSEEMMHHFAVDDRELPILDVLENSDVVATFAPRGLWVLGSDGRVDLITRSGTDILVCDTETSPLSWKLAARERRTKLSSFDKAVFFKILEAQ